MGCDIHGWVEIKPFKDESLWFSVVNVGNLVGRNYDMFGLLFGVRNYAGFKPVAENRGIPKDISEKAKKDIDKWSIDGHSHSYIYFNEIKKIDWGAEGDDARLHVYKKKNGKWVYDYKFLWSPLLGDKDFIKQMNKKGYVIVDGEKYVYEKVKARDVLDKRWKLLFDIMKLLAKEYGDKNVRMVVWFDN